MMDASNRGDGMIWDLPLPLFNASEWWSRGGGGGAATPFQASQTCPSLSFFTSLLLLELNLLFQLGEVDAFFLQLLLWFLYSRSVLHGLWLGGIGTWKKPRGRGEFMGFWLQYSLTQSVEMFFLPHPIQFISFHFMWAFPFEVDFLSCSFTCFSSYIYI